MAYGLQPITAPAAEPVTLAEVKLHCRVDSSAEDGLLTSLIRAARLEAERATDRCIAAASWRATFDVFPWVGRDPYSFRPRSLNYGYPDAQLIRLPRPPLVSVTSLKYYDWNGVLQTISSTLYLVSASREPGTIEPVFGSIWPVTRYQSDAVQVEYVAGWPCTSVAAAIAAGSQTVTPGSMAAIVAGSVLTIDVGTAQEQVVVASVTATTFTATFANAHAAGAKVTAVPDDIQAAMKIMVNHWYENRSATSAQAMSEVPLAAAHLLGGNSYGAYP